MTHTEMPADDDDKRISLRVSPEVYAQVERAAAREHRTVAGWVKALIASALEAGAGAEADAETNTGAGNRTRSRTKKP